MAESDYAVTVDELEKVAALGGISMESIRRNEDGTCSYCPVTRVPDEDHKQLLYEMSLAAFSQDSDSFAVFVAQNKQRIRKAAFSNEEVVNMLVMGYKLGISNGSAACMNDLGALYYMGELVDVDYNKAAELYEMAMEHGCYQSIVNLGYIWEYGETGETDYAKAFEYYALAASLALSSEATYKLGDMYARGHFVKRDMAKAFQLWSKSLEIAQGVVEIAHPALRIAQLLISDDCEEARVEFDALHALHLFQQAEIGLRIDIADGQIYYAKKLHEAIDGQEKARGILDIFVLDGE